ncbi:MAG: glutamyl-tRNA reductase [Acidobacteria bacterium]|nr:glutamyl-tRNA reductase [Acidobacteriota bacterium]
MSVLILGLSHKTAPVEVRERFALPGDRAEALVALLAGRPGIEEACILSTCNRVEFMVRSDDAHDAESSLLTFLNEDHHAPVLEATPYLYRYADREAIRHIFRVASSLDSMVVGEPQILGQVKDAYQAAKQAGTIRGPLDQLLTAAFRVARRVRNETGIGQMAVSISYVAVELARKIFGDLDGLQVLIIGAGKMSEATARHLQGAGAERLYVVNRTFERAQEMATLFQGEAVSYDRLHELLSKVDVVISSTGAPGYVLTREALAPVASARRGRPLFLVDIAVPRDVDPDINSLDEMFVYDIDDLQQVAEANLKQRRKEADLAEQIVDEEVDKVLHRIRGYMVKPTIVQLQQELDALRLAEIERFRSKLGALSPEQEQAIDGITRGLVRKIAHTPITEMKSMAGHPDGDRFVEIVKRIFNLRPR